MMTEYPSIDWLVVATIQLTGWRRAAEDEPVRGASKAATE